MRQYTAPPLTPPQIYLGRIPKGYPGTKRTVEYIKALIRAGAKDFYVRQKAIDILLQRGVTPKDYRGEIKALFEWVQQNVRYTKDPFRVEVLHSARRMLELRAGDCDDMTILLGSMLEAIGHPVRIVLAGPDPLRPRLFTHVYLEAYDKGHWIPLDPTMPYPMGWAPRGLVKEVIAIERRANMVSQDTELQATVTAAAVPDWLRGLIRAVRRQGLQTRDARVRSLWNLLRQRQLSGQSPWLQAVLRRIWRQGLTARPRPRTAQRLVQLLRGWGILPPAVVRPMARLPQSTRALAPVLRPVRPVSVRPIRPVSVRPVIRAGVRR
jgi:Transglutaminase-like superfamily